MAETLASGAGGKGYTIQPQKREKDSTSDVESENFSMVETEETLSP